MNNKELVEISRICAAATNGAGATNETVSMAEEITAMMKTKDYFNSFVDINNIDHTGDLLCSTLISRMFYDNNYIVVKHVRGLYEPYQYSNIEDLTDGGLYDMIVEFAESQSRTPGQMCRLEGCELVQWMVSHEDWDRILKTAHESGELCYDFYLFLTDQYAGKYEAEINLR